ncbi:tRNA 2-thiouridine(34) synthase MnmA [bacterium]|nr:tRNA 2-thiouridine(34) synthase MnmA [bacterium]
MRGKKVVVAMSGGVDSSVTAVLLKEKDFEVVGITMQIGREYEQDGRGGGEGVVEKAKKVAEQLGISHYVVDLEDFFRKKIINYFCKEYKCGRTPNPCIRCNQYIKFGALLEKAKELNADYLATGHYAQIEYDQKRKEFLLKRGTDLTKDQSYVLYGLKQRQLKHILLPLGGFSKKKIKQKAQELNLAVDIKSESQEICFIPDNDYRNFIKRQGLKRVNPGNILNKQGKVIGKHQGIMFYTIGQRKGIGIADKHPLYVIKIDKEGNTVTVGKQKDVYQDELIADNINWISKNKLKLPFKAQVKIRYRHSPSPATIMLLDKGNLKIKFDRPQWAITPGQAVVFYQKDTVLGGGRIVSTGIV